MLLGWTSRRRWVTSRPAAAGGAVILGLGLVGRRSRRGPTAPPMSSAARTPGCWPQATDLGPARSEQVQLTAALHRPARPVQPDRWARALTACRCAGATATPGRSSRGARRGGRCVRRGGARLSERSPGRSSTPPRSSRASRRPPAPRWPASAGSSAITPYREGLPPTPPLRRPRRRAAAHPAADRLQRHAPDRPGIHRQGRHRRGVQLRRVRPAGHGQLRRLVRPAEVHPEVVGGMPSQRNGEATMDLQMVHAVAPDARLVMVNARPTVEGGGGLREAGPADGVGGPASSPGRSGASPSAGDATG